MNPNAWRYGCVDCGSVNLFRRVRTGDYRCRSCGAVMQARRDRSL